MNCSKCGKPLAPGTKFCTNCGTKVEFAGSHCPKCGSETEAGAKFCVKCGTPLAGGQPAYQPAPGAAPQGQAPYPPRYVSPAAANPAGVVAKLRSYLMASGVISLVATILNILFFIIFTISGIILIVTLSEAAGYYRGYLDGILALMTFVVVGIIILLLLASIMNLIYTIRTFKFRGEIRYRPVGILSRFASAGKTIGLLILNLLVMGFAIFELSALNSSGLSRVSGGAVVLCVFILISGILGVAAMIVNLVARSYVHGHAQSFLDIERSSF